MNNSKGFTLMELMVVVGIVAILVSIAVPNFKTWVEHQRLSASVRTIHSLFQTSRMEAIKEGQNVVVDFPNSGGYMAFVDNDGDRVADTGERVIASGTFPNHIYFDGVGFHLNGGALANERKTHFDSRGLTVGRSGEVALANFNAEIKGVTLNNAGVSRVVNMSGDGA